MIPGSVAPGSAANWPLNNVCNGTVVTAPLTSEGDARRYGTIYVFKDYSDNLYVTVAVDGLANSTGFPFITLPNVAAFGSDPTKLFAWPDLNLLSYNTAFNYVDQVPNGR